MSFGVGIGDAIALAGVVKGLVIGLRAAKGAVEQYDAVMHGLTGLERQLSNLESLHIDASLEDERDALEEEIRACRTTVDGFMTKTETTRRRLTQTGTPKVLGRLDWAILKKESIAEFRSNVSDHRNRLSCIVAVIHLLVRRSKSLEGRSLLQ